MTGAVALGPDGRLKPIDLVPALPPGTVLHVRDTGRARPGLHLIRTGGRLALVRGPVGPGLDFVGRVAAVEFRGRRFPLDRGPLARVPLSWLARTLGALEAAARVLAPFEPPLYLGDERACLESVRAKYSQPLDVARYAAGPAGLEPWEEQIVRASVRPGGRVLDIGCGAGREASSGSTSRRPWSRPRAGAPPRRGSTSPSRWAA
jgi:hypothetical protein